MSIVIVLDNASFSTDYWLYNHTHERLVWYLEPFSSNTNVLLLYPMLNSFDPPCINSFFVILETKLFQKIFNHIMLHLFDLFEVR